MGPGEYTVVAEDLLAFDLRYGLAGRNVTGQYRGNLSNRGGTLRLLGPRDETIQEFTYEDGWHLNTDGVGHSLVIVDELAAVGAWSRREGWKESDLSFGSPGEAEDASGGRQRPGDANQDASLDIGDAVSMLLIIFGAPTRSPPCDGAVDSEANVALLDFNADRLVDQSDAVYLLVYLYRSGPPHTLGQRCVRIEGCADACLR